MSRIINSINCRLHNFFNKFGFNNNIVSGLSICRRFNSLTLVGRGNTISIKSKLSKDVKIVIYGNNHHLEIDENVTFKKGLIWFEDEDCQILIHKGTTIESAVLSVAEKQTSICIGEDCMLSRDIRIATSDAHSVIDLGSGKRVNHAADVRLEDHVWVGNRSFINKGCVIGTNSIVAGSSVVTHSVDKNTIVAGIPAKQVKSNISWSRKRILS